jgi:hypothetical protein
VPLNGCCCASSNPDVFLGVFAIGLI